MTTEQPTIRALPQATPDLERTAFGLDLIQDENRRLVAFGFEMLRAGGFECAIGDTLDLKG
jgi:hypothetical protein